jgi:L-threonate 2-dehydrogenase
MSGTSDRRNGDRENIVVGLVAPGNMGAGVGGRIRRNGGTVRTSLAGRGPDSARRAREADLSTVETDDELVAGADLILSIVPAAESENIARRLAPALTRASTKPVYVDCNAISPQTVQSTASIIAPTGCGFVDVGIFGPPPTADPESGPIFYAAGPQVDTFARLANFGLRVHDLGGPVGAASTLKLIHVGITKGFTAIAAAMILCASENNLDTILMEQISKGHPDMAHVMAHQMKGMFSKAYRWVGEMEELSEFAAPGSETSELYRVIAELYERLAKAYSDKDDVFERITRFSKSEAAQAILH